MRDGTPREPGQSRLHLSFFDASAIPTIYQTESSECGLACIAMVCHAHGRRQTLESLRLRFPTPATGIKLSTLIGIAGSLGFTSRALKTELEEIGRLRTPCILHWDLNHFVVLGAVRRNRFAIHDPASGRRWMSAEELASHYTGVALELAPAPENPASEPHRKPPIRWWRLPGPVRGFTPALAQAVALALLIEIVSLALPFISQLSVEGVLGRAAPSLFFTLVACFAALVVFGGALKALRAWIVATIRMQLSVQLSSRVFLHLLNLPAGFFERRRLGDIVMRFGSINSLQQILSNSVIEAVLDGIMTMLTFGIMATYSVRLALIPVAATLLNGAVRGLIYRKYSETVSAQVLQQAKQQSRLIEAVRLAMTIKTTNAQPEVHARFEGGAYELGNIGLTVQRLDTIALVTADVCQGLTKVALFACGGLMVGAGDLHPGSLVALAMYGQIFLASSFGLLDSGMQLAFLRIQGTRLADIVGARQEENLTTNLACGELGSSLKMTDVHFRYANESPWILKGVNLDIGEGEIVAIGGASGVGKSTLVKLLAGTVDPVVGSIKLDGVNISNLGKRRYRDVLGIVMQESELLVGSIADNICMFDTEVSMAKLESAARLALIHEEILRLPLGFNTVVGGLSAVLSAGQRQRLLIARALYRRPKILILDEATCHVDPELESRILSNLRGTGVSILMVTHRGDLLRAADKALVLHDGNLVAPPGG